VAVGAGLLLFLLFRISFLLYGVETGGTVAGKHTGADDDGPTFTLAYRYVFDGLPYDASEQVDESLYRAREPGDRIVIIVHALLPAWGSRIRENTEGWSLWMLALFALFWNGIVGIFVAVLYAAPWRERLLLRTGEAVEGIVLRKEEDTGGDSTTWSVEYEFMPVPSADTRTAGPVTGKMNVERADYLAVAPGDRVVVVYDRFRPGRNVVYTWGGYELS
jgi:hypothetical protein